MLIKRGQNFFDAVIESTGSMDNVFLMAVANDMSPTDLRKIGDEVVAAGQIKKQIIAQFGFQHYPASESKRVKKFALCGGIPMSL